jgi:hypothetical protein
MNTNKDLNRRLGIIRRRFALARHVLCNLQIWNLLDNCESSKSAFMVVNLRLRFNFDSCQFASIRGEALIATRYRLP